MEKDIKNNMYVKHTHTPEIKGCATSEIQVLHNAADSRIKACNLHSQSPSRCVCTHPLPRGAPSYPSSHRSRSAQSRAELPVRPATANFNTVGGWWHTDVTELGWVLLKLSYLDLSVPHLYDFVKTHRAAHKKGEFHCNYALILN